MSVMEQIEAGHQGKLFATIGLAAGVDEQVARAGLERLLPELARRFRERARDAIEHQALLDVIASGRYGRYLEDPRALLSRDAIQTGEEALSYLYGSLDAARDRARAIGPPADLDPEVFARLTTLAASLLLAGMAHRREQIVQQELAEDASLAAALKGLGRAALRGFVEGSMRAVRPLRGSRSFTRRMQRRRNKAAPSEISRPSLDELLGDLLQDARRRGKN